jgi:hypothetical protein
VLNLSLQFLLEKFFVPGKDLASCVRDAHRITRRSSCEVSITVVRV